MIGRSIPTIAASKWEKDFGTCESRVLIGRSNPSDEVVEWFWKIVKAWPAERKVSV